jgi:hypothetical protein
VRECAALREQVANALEEAQACSALGSRSCIGFVDNECDCPVPVNNPMSMASNRYTDAVADLKARCTVVCPAVVCPEPASATCQSGLGGGRCVVRGSDGPGGPGSIW